MSEAIIPNELCLTAHIGDTPAMRAVEEVCREAYLVGYADGREAAMREREAV